MKSDMNKGIYKCLHRGSQGAQNGELGPKARGASKPPASAAANAAQAVQTSDHSFEDVSTIEPDNWRATGKPRKAVSLDTSNSVSAYAV